MPIHVLHIPLSADQRENDKSRGYLNTHCYLLDGAAANTLASADDVFGLWLGSNLKVDGVRHRDIGTSNTLDRVIQEVESLYHSMAANTTSGANNEHERKKQRRLIHNLLAAY